MTSNDKPRSGETPRGGKPSGGNPRGGQGPVPGRAGQGQASIKPGQGQATTKPGQGSAAGRPSSPRPGQGSSPARSGQGSAATRAARPVNPARPGKPGTSGRPGPAPRPGQKAAGGKGGGNRYVAPTRGNGRPRGPLFAWGSVGVVIVVAIVFIVVALTSSTPKNASPNSRPLAPPSLVSAVTTIPASVFNTVGLGVGTTPPFVKTSGQKLLTSAGKPQLIYVGGEYCPYCAIDRWALIAALSRFGTFSNLKLMTSSLADTESPGTPTFTFFGSSYTSPYLVFTPLELENVNETTAGMPTVPAALQPVIAKYSGTTYFPNSGGGIGFPFLEFGNQYVASGLETWLNPYLIQKLSRADIAAAMAVPSNPAAQAIDAEANYIAAGVCSIDGNMPTSVCKSSGVEVAAKALAKLKPVK